MKIVDGVFPYRGSTYRIEKEPIIEFILNTSTDDFGAIFMPVFNIIEYFSSYHDIETFEDSCEILSSINILISVQKMFVELQPGLKRCEHGYGIDIEPVYRFIASHKNDDVEFRVMLKQCLECLNMKTSHSKKEDYNYSYRNLQELIRMFDSCLLNVSIIAQQ